MFPNIEELPKSIISTVTATPKFLSIPPESISVCLTLGQVYLPTEKIIRKTNNQEVLDLSSIVKFPPFVQNDKLIHPQALLRIEGIIEVLQNDEELSRSFYTACDAVYAEIIKNARKLDILTAFIVIFNSISKQFDLAPPKAFITSPVIFPYWVTNYDNFDNEFYQQINTIRNLCINLMLYRGVEDFIQILQTNFQHPLIFAEILHRMINIQSKINLSDYGIEPLIQSIMQAMIFYQSFDQLTKEESKVVNEAKITLIRFVNNYLLQDDLLDQIFHNHIFITSFLGMLYDLTTQGLCIAHLNRYISMKQSVDNIEFLEKIYQIAIYTLENCGDPDVIQLGCIIFEFICTILTLYPSKQSLFEPLFEDIKIHIVNIKQSEHARTYIHNIITFYSISDEHHFSNPELLSIQIAIKTIYGTDIPRTIFLKILQIISSSHISVLTSQFEIKEGKALKLLVAIHENSPQFEFAFNYVCELINFSPKNAQMAHKGELDIYLIDFIYGLRNEKRTPELEATVSKIFELLIIIFSQISSAAVARYFIRLVCPNDGRTLPFYHFKAVEMMQTVLANSKYRPTLYLPLIEKIYFDIDGFSPNYLNKPFTLAFWLYINEVDYKYNAQIFYMIDDKDGRFGVFCSGDKILISMMKGNSEHTAKPTYGLTLQKWNFVVIQISNEDRSDKYTCFVSINGGDNQFFFFPKVVYEQNNTKLAKIGGLTLDSTQINSCSFLGPISFYPSVLSKEQILQLYDRKCTIVPPSKTSALFYLSPIEKDDEVTLINQINNDITVCNISYQYNRVFNFAEVLVNHCGVDVLLPLFAQWDLPDTDGIINESYPGRTVEVLESALLMSAFAQKAFAENEGFKIISHLIINSGKDHISYSLYMMFYQIFNNLNILQAKESIFREILLNNEIWINAEALDHTRITRHWCRSLCTPNIFTVSFLDFGILLSILRLYYWYEDDRNTYHIVHDDRCKGQKLNVEECRKNILTLAHYASSLKFTESDFAVLMSHVLTASSPKQVIDLLVFIRELINDGTLKKLNKTTILLLIQYLFNTDSENIAVLLISTLIDAHKAGIVHEVSLENNLDIIMHQLSANFINESNLEVFIAMCRITPELFTICTWMAVNIGEEGINNIIKMLPPKKEYKKLINWSVFLIHSLFESKYANRKKVIDYLLAIAADEVLTLVSMIDIIGRTFVNNQDDCDDIIHDVIFAAGILVHNSPNIISFHDYTNLLVHFLFFRPVTDEKNTTFYKIFNNSIFSSKPKKTRRGFPDLGAGTPPRVRSSPSKSPRRGRHCIRRTSVIKFVEELENYSPQLALKAMSKLKLLKNMQTRRYSLFQKKMSSVQFSPSAIRQEIKHGFEEIHEEIKLNEERAELLNLMPYETDKKIAMVGETDYMYRFGFRMEVDQSWADLDLALQFITMFVTNPIPEFTEIAIIISGFLARNGSNVTDSVMESMKNDQKSIYSSAISFMAMMGEVAKDEKNHEAKAIKQKICFDFIQQIPNKLRDRMLDAAPLRILKALLKEQSQNSKMAFQIFATISDELVAMANNKVNDDEDLIHSNIIANKKFWQKTWHVLTLEDSPWNPSIPAALKHIQHYKRDNVLSALGIPVTLKINNKFDDHTLAALMRDKGSWWTAEEAFEAEKSKLREIYEKDRPAPLFEIGEIDHNDIGIEPSIKTKVADIDNERCLVELPCEVISPQKTLNAKFALFPEQIFINYDSGKVKVIKSANIHGIFFRTRLHHPTAIEIFLVNGISYLFNFPNINSLTILKQFDYVRMPQARYIQKMGFRNFFSTTDVTDKWIKGSMTNFEYLLQLNMFSGRSFNDMSMYPIIPWVIADYESLFLDLKDPKSFRDLSKPIGALNEERLNMLKSKLDALRMAGIAEPFIYSSTYNCPLSIFLYLIRLEPFTTLHIQMQSGRFDLPTRLFTSIQTLWECSTNNGNDYRELTPEFFSSPEFLTNSNNLPLGISETNNVEMPKWASSPFDFVYKNRKALESDYVSSNLHKWIDLVWGHKQRSYNDDNVYMREMYSDIWSHVDQNNPSKRAEIEAVLSHVGQVPPMLFTTPHPERLVTQTKQSQLMKNVSVNMAMTNLVIASIVLTSSPTKYRLTLIDEGGVSTVGLFDATCLNKQIQSALSKNTNQTILRGRSISTNILGKNAPASLKKNKTRTRKDSADKGYLVIDIHITQLTSVRTKTVKGFRSAEKFLYAETTDGTLYYSEENKCEIFKAFPHVSIFTRQRSPITSLSSDMNYLITSNSDNVISVYHTPSGPTPIFTVPSFSSKVKSCCLSSDFRQFVYGTKNGRLTIGSLITGNVTRIVELGAHRPSSIMITPGWGFIVIYSTDLSRGYLRHFIEIFSINGDKIKESEIGSKVQCWSSYKDSRGFDYVVMATESGDIYHFEAFYADIGKRIFAIDAQIISIQYFNDDGVVCAVIEDGRMLFIPSIISDN